MVIFTLDGYISCCTHLGKAAVGTNITANPSQQWVSLRLSCHPALCTDSLLKSLQEKASHIQAPQGFGHKRPFSLTMVKIWAKGKDDPGQRWKFQGDEMWNIVKATLATWPHPVTSEELSCFFHYNICTWTGNYIFFFLQLGGKVPLIFLILEYAQMLQHSFIETVKTV